MPPQSSQPDNSGNQPDAIDQKLEELKAQRAEISDSPNNDPFAGEIAKPVEIPITLGSPVTKPAGAVVSNRSLANKLGLIVAAIFFLGGSAIAALVFTSQKKPQTPTKPAIVEPLTETVVQPTAPLPSENLTVATLSAQAASISALSVAGSAQIQGNLIVNGSGSFGGSIQASNFNGSGAGLTGVNAALLGGHPASFFTNLANSIAGAALLAGNNTFTGSNTFTGGLTALGQISAASLTLGQPLSVTNGGIGLNNVPAASVLYGQGGPTLGLATPSGPGLCLLSGVNSDSWGSCSSAVPGVAFLDGLFGTLTLANSTGAGSTITINDASTAQKGIAQFNATDFQTAAGVVDTVQSIATTAAPTFAGLFLSSPLTVANGGTGAPSLTANGVLLGNGTSPISSLTTATVGDCLMSTAGAPVFQLCPGSAGAGGVNTLGGTANKLAKFTAGQSIGNSSITDTGSSISVTPAANNTAVFQVQNAAGLSLLNVDSLSNLTTFGNITATVGQAIAGAIALGDGTADNFGATVNTTTLSQNRTITIPDASGQICLTTGNCSGIGGVIGGAGTTGRVPVFTTASTIGNSPLSATASSVTLTPAVDSTAAFQVQNASTGAVLVVDTQNGRVAVGGTPTAGTFQAFGPTIVGYTNSLGALSVVDAGGATEFGVDTVNHVIGVNPDSNASAGTQLVNSDALAFQSNYWNGSSSVTNAYEIQNLALSTAPAYELAFKNNSSQNVLTLQGNGAATFQNGTNSASAFQIQNSLGRNLVNVDTVGNATTFGNITSTGGQGIAGTLNLADGTADNFGATLNTTILSQNRTITIPDASGQICLTSGNCSGVGGVIGGAGTTNRLAVFTSASTIGNSEIVDTGASVTIAPPSNSTSTFVVQNAAGSSLLNVDAGRALVTVSGNGTSSSAAPSFVADWQAHAVNQTTVNVVPVTVGDLIAFVVETPNTGVTVTSVAGGEVANWNKVTTNNGSGHEEIWQGVVTATGASTVTVTFSSAPGFNVDLDAEEFTSGQGPNSVWTVTATGSLNNPSSTTITYPSLTDTKLNGLYWGYARDGSSGSAGSTSGFSYVVTGSSNVVTYNPALSNGTTYAPTAVSSPADVSDGIAMVIVPSVGGGGLNVNGALNVSGSSAFSSNVVVTDSSTAALQIQNSGGAAVLNVDTQNGRVGIGTSAPTQALNVVNGNAEIDYGGLTMGGVAAPVSAPTATPTGVGVLTGAYNYYVSYLTENGQTLVGPGVSVNPSSQQVNLTNIPTGPAGVVGRKIYRTIANPPFNASAFLLTTINDNTTTSYLDNTPDGGLGAVQPTYNTTSYISNPQGSNAGEAFGLNATVGSCLDATAIGNSALALGCQSLAVGQGAVSDSTLATALGQGTTAHFIGVAVGGGSTAGNQGVAVGVNAFAGSGSIALGNAATAGTNQLVIGGSFSQGSYIQNAYIGSGIQDTVPVSVTIHATGGSGTDIAGANLSLAGGMGTGAGNGGSINFQIAKPGLTGATLNTLANVETLSGSNGAALFQNSANSTSAFQVQDASGNELINVDTTDRQVGIGTNVEGAALTVKGLTNDSSAYSTTLTNSNGENIVSARNDGQVVLGRAPGCCITLGHATIGANPDNGFNQAVFAQQITTGPTASSLNSISAWVQNTESTPNNKYQVAIYADNSGSPGALIASSAQGTLSAGAWNTLGVSASLAANTKYWLAFAANVQNGNTNLVPYDPGGNHDYMSPWANAGVSMPATFTTTFTSGALDSIYANVVEAGGLATTLTVDPTNGVNITTPTNSTTALQVQNSTGGTAMTVDTQNGRLGVETAAPTANLQVLNTNSNGTLLDVQNSSSFDTFQILDTGKVTLGKAPTTVLGNGTVGTGGNTDFGLLTAQKFTTGPTGGGALASMSVYIHSSVSSSPNNLGQMGIYTDTSSGCAMGADCPSTLVASTAQTALNPNSWNTMPITATLSANTTYWLTYWENDPTGSWQALVHPSTAGTPFDFGSVAFAGSMPGSYPAVTFNDSSYDASIYATYASNGPALTSDPTANAIDLGYNTGLNLQGPSSYISNSEGYTNSEAFGLSTGVTGTQAAVFGDAANAQGSGAAFGYGATASNAGTAIGWGAGNSGGGAVSLGYQASAGVNSIALGVETNAGNANSIAIGDQAQTTATNQLVIGHAQASGFYIQDAYIGSGVTDASPVNFTLHATGGNGTNIAGANLSLAGGIGTGTGNGGNINFQIAAPGLTGATPNTLGTVASINGSNGAATFENSVNSTAAFQVQNAIGVSLLQVDSSTTLNLLGDTASNFETGNAWAVKGSPTSIAQDSTAAYSGSKSLKIVTGATANSGAQYSYTFTPSTTYTLSLYLYSNSSFNTINIGRQDQSGTDIDCLTGQTVVATGWTRFSCSFTTGPTITSSNIYVKDTGTSDTFWLDGVQLEAGSMASTYNPGGQLQLNGVISSPVALKNTSNSTTAFKLQDAGGSNVLNVDTTNNILKVDSGVMSTLGNWVTSTTSLPVALNNLETVTANGYVYSIGGRNATPSAVSTVNYAKVNSDGSLGSFTATASLPTAIYDSYAIAAHGYIYVVGGNNGAATVNTVYYAHINSDGTLGSWVTSPNTLPVALANMEGSVANGYIYILGGFTGAAAVNTVYYAKLNSDGSIGAWNTNVNNLAISTYNGGGLAANGYIYSLAGFGQGTKYEYAQLNTNGSTGAWTLSGAAFSSSLQYASAVIADGIVYIPGGWTGAACLNTVESGTLGNGGALGTFTNQVTTLPNGLCHTGPVTVNGYVYMMGGSLSGGSDQSAIYYASTPRLQVAGSLDLVGLEGSNLANSGSGGRGSSGGSLTAGNTNIVGTLQVQDNATFTNDVSVNGSLTANGDVTLADQSNSTTAFQVQNASAASVLTADTTNNILSVNSGVSATLGNNSTWSSTTVLPSIRSKGAAVAYGGYLYYVGGNTTTTYYGKLNNDGTVTSWSTTTALPTTTVGPQVQAANGYMYVIGGFTASYTNAVLYARINPDGTLGSWTTSPNSLPASESLYDQGIYANGYLYAIGGSNGAALNTVYYTKVHSDGTIDPWTTSGNSLVSNNSGGSVVAADGYIFLLGGSQTTAYEETQLNSDGSTGAWTKVNIGPSLLTEQDAFVADGNVYVVGGYNGTNCVASIQYASLSNSGTLGSWTTAGSALPAARCNSRMAVANGYVYYVGGLGSDDATAQNTVYYTSLPRTQIAGSLDLVGLNAQNLANSGSQDIGSTAGNLSAGNTNIVGTLQVQGGVAFNRSLMVNGALSAGSDVTFADLTNSTTAFQVQNASSSSVLDVDTTNGRIGILTNTPTVATLAFDGSANRSIGVETQATANTAGANLTLTAATGNGTGAGGTLALNGGTGGSSAAGGAVTVTGGTAGGGNRAGGGVTVQGGTASGTGTGGTVTIQGGNASATAGSAGGSISITAAGGSTTTTGGAGGTVTVVGGYANGTGNNNGGNITLQAGLATGTGTPGSVIVQNAATSTNAFQVNTTSAASVLNVDTTNGTLTVQGLTSDNTENALAVEDTNSNVVAQVRNDGYVALGKNAAGSPTLGMTSIGSHNDSGYLNLVTATKITTGAAAVTVNSMSAYIKSSDASPNNKYIFGIYSDSSGNPNSLIASSAQGTITNSAWNTLAISASLAANTTYWLSFSTNTTSNVVSFVPYNSVGTSSHKWMTGYGSAGVSNPATFTVSGGANTTDSIYASVTETGYLSTAVIVDPTLGVTVNTPTNSTTALQVQNSAGNPVVAVGTTSAGSLSVTSQAAPTGDIVSISNASQADNTGINGLHTTYVGGTAATEGAGIRVDYTPGGTSGSAWDGLHIVAAGAPASGVSSYGIKLEGNATAHSGLETAINITTGWDVGIAIANGGVQMNGQTDPSAPAISSSTSQASGAVKLYAQSIDGRMFIKALGPNDNSYPLQTALFSHEVCWISGTESGTDTKAGVCNNNPQNIQASVPAPTEATGIWSDFLSVAANSNETAAAGDQSSAVLYERGSSTGESGFFFTSRLYLPDATSTYTTAPGATRFFTGLADNSMTSGSGPLHADGVAANRAGFMFSTTKGDTNFMFSTDNTTAENYISTGMPFNGAHLYNFYIYCPNKGTTIYWRIDDLTAATTDAGTVTTDLPTATSALRVMAGITNTAVVAAGHQLGVETIYGESGGYQ